jgi:hypothetical protein
MSYNVKYSMDMYNIDFYNLYYIYLHYVWVICYDQDPDPEPIKKVRIGPDPDTKHLL